ncbi:unnamed protein product [Bemisia tabaci]|uniref:Uncharacterized protein n=1 Tax=Bemisia tabaci TaxID=7038 RepID=A0A9P0F7S0_BEMTA|nr:unnamed protein product [Bemisia tabaci]
MPRRKHYFKVPQAKRHAPERESRVVDCALTGSPEGISNSSTSLAFEGDSREKPPLFACSSQRRRIDFSSLQSENHPEQIFESPPVLFGGTLSYNPIKFPSSPLARGDFEPDTLIVESCKLNHTIQQKPSKLADFLEEKTLGPKELEAHIKGGECSEAIARPKVDELCDPPFKIDSEYEQLVAHSERPVFVPLMKEIPLKTTAKLTQHVTNEAYPLEVNKIEDWVYVSIPMIFVDAEENGRDRPEMNLYQIEYKTLKKIMSQALEIDSASNSRQYEIFREKFKIQMNFLRLSETVTSKDQSELDCWKSLVKYMDITETVLSMIESHETDEEYKDVCGEGISFDIIRRFTNDPRTHILKDYEKCSWRGIVSYSQLKNKRDLVEQARLENNDTDLNRIYYILGHFLRTILFDKSKLCNTVAKIFNITLVFVEIAQQSKPVSGYSLDTCVINNLAGFLIDILIRTRNISRWRRLKYSKLMLSDMAYNYDRGHNIMVALCQLETPRERIQKLIGILKKHEKLKQLFSIKMYDEYERILGKQEREIFGEKYYFFDLVFLKNFLESDIFQRLIKDPQQYIELLQSEKL